MKVKDILYSDWKVDEFSNRYIQLSKFYEYISNNLSEFAKIIGYSTLNRPIYRITLGNGNTKILAWTQMHGNESTGTLACLDVIEFLTHSKNSKFLSSFTFDIILMLNPDGAEAWQRRNALGIDINRDFNAEHSAEIKILKLQFQQKKYHLCLNLHDQRTIFNVNHTNFPSTLSFLAPSFDEARSLSSSRIESMRIISYIFTNVNIKIKANISRFSDEFYPNATGDNFQKLDVPTILIEAGHFLKDYNREVAREYLFKSIIIALNYFREGNSSSNKLIEEYNRIPINTTDYYDVIIQNLKVTVNNKCSFLDIAIQYKEIINHSKDSLEFLPIIEDIGDLSLKKSHKHINGMNIDYKFDFKQIEIGKNATEILNIYKCKQL